jgi:CRP-like cAMP-binding protein
MLIPITDPDLTIQQIIDGISYQYQGLTNECKLDFGKNVTLKKVEKASILVKEGQYSDKLYYIVKGCIRVYYNKEGKEISDWFAFENEFVSSINSFFLSIPSPHYVQAVEDTTFLEITREDAFKLMEIHHSFESLARKAITQIMLQLQSRIVSLQFETAQQKYNNLLLIRPDFVQRVPLSYIATFLGITMETLSRIRNPKNRI